MAIAKSVLWDPKVVLLDKPTAALGVAQTREVLDLVRRLAEQSLGVVLISHNMSDVFEVSDRIATLYLGRLVADLPTAELTHSQVVELITAGRSGDLGRIRASVFVIAATVSAVGAIVYSSKVGSVDPSAGGGTVLLYAVGAAVIGGTSLFGGKGRVSNAVIGGAVLAMVANGLGLLRQPAAVFIITGLVLLLAASVDALSRRRARAGRKLRR